MKTPSDRPEERMQNKNVIRDVRRAEQEATKFVILLSDSSGGYDHTGDGTDSEDCRRRY